MAAAILAGRGVATLFLTIVEKTAVCLVTYLFTAHHFMDSTRFVEQEGKPLMVSNALRNIVSTV
jgi:hypothetical protein